MDSDAALVIMVGVFVILIISLVVIFEQKDANLSKDFCKEGLIQGRGSVDYCKGSPFVCSQEGCWYTRAVNNCWTETYYSGKILVTEEVCE